MNGLREIATRTEQGFDEGRSAQPSQIFERVFALMARGAMGTTPVMQEKILAAQRGYAGVLKNPAGEIFVRGQRRGSGVVLRIGRTAPGAEINDFGWRSDAEDKSGSAVDVVKREAEFRTSIFRIDRLVRIEARLTLEIPASLACNIRRSGIPVWSLISNEFFARARQLTAGSRLISAS